MSKVIVVHNRNISLDKEWKRTTPIEKEVVNILGQKVNSSFKGRTYEVVCDATCNFPLIPYIIRLVAGIFAVLATLGTILLCDCSSSTIKGLFKREQSARYIIEIQPKKEGSDPVNEVKPNNLSDPKPSNTKTPQTQGLKWAAIKTYDHKIDQYCEEARKAATQLTGPVDRSLLNHVPRWSAEDFNQQIKTLPPFVFRLISKEAVPGIKLELLSPDQFPEFCCNEERIPLLTADQINKSIKQLYRLSHTYVNCFTPAQLSQIDLSILDDQQFILGAPTKWVEALIKRIPADTLKQRSKHFFREHWRMVPDQVLAEYLEKNSITKPEFDSIFSFFEGRTLKAFSQHLSVQKLAELTHHLGPADWVSFGPCESVAFLESCLKQKTVTAHYFRFALFPTSILNDRLSKTRAVFQQLSGTTLINVLPFFGDNHWEALDTNQVLGLAVSGVNGDTFRKLFNPHSDLGKNLLQALQPSSIDNYASAFQDAHWRNLSHAQIYALNYDLITPKQFDLFFLGKTNVEVRTIFQNMPNPVFLRLIQRGYRLALLSPMMTEWQRQELVKRGIQLPGIN